MSNDSLQPIVSCMGQPVAGNPTQFMIERAFRAAGLDWRYLTLEVAPDGLADAIRGMRVMGFRGGNFTIPHKVAVIQHLDRLTEAAELMGAVNCVFREGEELVGENTDGKGFVQSLRELVDPAEKTVTLLGAGGAARAIGVEVGLAGAANITVVNRSPERGEELVKLLNERVQVNTQFVQWDGDYQLAPETEIVINATSIGLGDAHARVPLDYDSLTADMVAADVVFNPPRTIFLQEAERRGCRILDGLGMLVNQGVVGFQIWTGVDPDTGVMREALEEYLEV